ncbi:MAG: O-antigen biosynthesis protein WbqP [Erysipelotrichaceae bacterium]|nr:MAG: O-antigen biosynthesis protein [Erysipelotrichaceae bacterium]TXT18457.1 MAG: O-antigen biosynthesis protein WbqP [Erysipelotrichaceae bacterium]
MYPYIKRVLDILFSLLMIVALSPILVLCSILIKLESKGPILFKQKRVGRNQELFTIYKFRTMRVDAPKDTPTHLLDSSVNFITPLGEFLRKSSLDELPQLVNILQGHMSFVGPRPALWNQYDLTEERQKRSANDIRPGLTGWAQINGRDELPIEVKAKYDGEYVSRMSLAFDIEIFFKTIFKVLVSEGVKEGKQNK